jgi:hypothetical protein
MINSPGVNDCKPGLWAELSNGWIVGPIVETDLSHAGVYVQFGVGLWQLDIAGQHGVTSSSPRLVVRLGEKDQFIRQAEPSAEVTFGLWCSSGERVRGMNTIEEARQRAVAILDADPLESHIDIRQSERALLPPEQKYRWSTVLETVRRP